MAANDLIEESTIHRGHIEKANKQWKIFLEKNMNASLSLLRVYYMREELVGKNTRLAVLFLKLWQYTAMKGKQHLSNNSLEIICTYLFNQLKITGQSNSPISSFDIIQEFFQLIVKCRNSANGPMIIQWPYQQGPTAAQFPDPKNQKSGEKQKKYLINLHLSCIQNVIGNMERKFGQWKSLFDACEYASKIFNSRKETQFIDFIVNSFRNNTKGKMNIEDMLLLGYRDVHINNSHVIAKVTLEQCFYEWKDRQLGPTMEEILEKGEELYKSYWLDLCCVTAIWSSIKSIIRKNVILRWGIMENYVWTKGDDSKEVPSPALDEFIENLEKYYEKEMENDSASSSGHDDGDDDDDDDDDDESSTDSKVLFAVLLLFDYDKKYQKISKQRPVIPTEISVSGKIQTRVPINAIVLDPPRPDSSNSEDENTEEMKQDTTVDMIACICENVFNQRWFTVSEFYAIFSRSYSEQVFPDCPKNLIACEKIIRTAKHPNSNFKMFHKKKKVMDV
ncbi:Casein kinase II regulatory subunit [Reticulomyxa filosa]|uniref:Casein kinase II regulatory subunit n=1 Tax=Reticulomyxa filosa TaxID=46433 RepID=X6P5E8_RETFI|nr:Casein kinase II regulatory subunit [Reticulomyxa filosa]|eukprot:ETO33391.1 Casein kinase II regulatory subunit [Reticulomyxa filosa]